MTAEKRFENGFSFLASFAWAKAMDDFAPNKDTAYYTNSCTCGRSFDYGPSDDDLNKVVKINGDYLSQLVHRDKVTNSVLNGWELTGIMNWWPTGNPFTVVSGVDNSFSAIEGDRADLSNISVARQSFEGHRPHPDNQLGLWFNPADFVVNQVGTFGDAAKNNLRAPGCFNTDLASIKNTTFERVQLQLRADFFNVTNHPNFGTPGNSVTSPGFGQITGTLGSIAYGGPMSYGTAQPRMMQFGMKASF